MDPLKLLLLAFVLPVALPAQDRALQPINVQRRLALVIGNGAYTDAPLPNAPVDARDIAKSLGRLGFTVTSVLNANQEELERSVDRFAASLRSGDLAWFYYAGHGLQVRQENYLVPIGFRATSEADVRFRAYPASLVREKLEETGARVRVLVLDACRNNPYKFSRTATNGLAAMMSPAEGTIVAFAASDGQTASDAASYTQKLLKVLETPGLHIKEVFERVRAEVYYASNRQQNPAVYDTVIGRLLLRAEDDRTVQPASTVSEEDTYWKKCDEQKGSFCRLYLEKFPEGRYAPLAKLLEPAKPVKEASPRVAARILGVIVNTKDGLPYVLIPPGRFTMGCASVDPACQPNEGPAHDVEIKSPFWIGQTEVTQRAWSSVLNRTNPSATKGANLPVESVTWTDAVRFCAASGLRLPTEAEWEYAALGGLGSTQNPSSPTGHLVQPVASHRENGYHLFDMLENVWEWVQDDWTPNYSATLQRDTTKKVIRGGERIVQRDWVPENTISSSLGFRCAGEKLPE